MRRKGKGGKNQGGKGGSLIVATEGPAPTRLGGADKYVNPGLIAGMGLGLEPKEKNPTLNRSAL